MTVQLCVHEMQPSTCTWCRSVPRYTGPHWDASFPGPCGGCSQGIEVGDRIRWTQDGVRVQHSRHG